MIYFYARVCTTCNKRVEYADVYRPEGDTILVLLDWDTSQEYHTHCGGKVLFFRDKKEMKNQLSKETPEHIWLAIMHGWNDAQWRYDQMKLQVFLNDSKSIDS